MSVTYADGRPVTELTLLEHIRGGWRLYVTLTGETLCEGPGRPNCDVLNAACESYNQRERAA
jgi:hypothetical protein